MDRMKSVIVVLLPLLATVSGCYYLIIASLEFSLLYASLTLISLIFGFGIMVFLGLYQDRPYIIVFVNIPALALIAIADIADQRGAVVSVLIGSGLACTLIISYLTVENG